MTVHRSEFTVATRGRGSSDVSEQVARIVHAAAVETGLCTVFVHHTSASLMLCENADPTVRSDFEAWLRRAVPDGDPIYAHTAEGPDDMPAHVRSILTGSSLTVPVHRGALDLGTWQGLFLLEHRQRGHQRRISVTLVGE